MTAALSQAPTRVPFPGRPVAPARPTVRATFTATPPVLDGVDTDAVWRTTPLIDDFPESYPVEALHPRFRTTGRVAYDARNLYVFLRAYDPHPDSIITMLARRDVSPPSDFAGVLVDGYRDRRTGFEFDVNPSGAKADYAFRDDGGAFDDAWDGVWDVATRIDSLGWTAEFRIPLSQVGYAAGHHPAIGIYFWRVVKRAEEVMDWPMRHRSLPGLASQFGDLTDLDSLAPPHRGELVPYILGKVGTVGQSTAGADVKYALAPNLTLNATLNPDFGQVEADPAELNLSAYETFFTERRPFFVQGAGQFTYDLNCGLYSCYHEGLFYSRRIGRGGARILGAGKLTGRVGDLGFGALGAATAAGDGGLEPPTRYGVLRASRSFRQGESDFGIQITGMDRDLDPARASSLHRDAYAGGVDFRHRFLHEYTLHGSVDWSRVDGSAPAIVLLQRDPVHNYQRPDGAQGVDTTRTWLKGDDEQLAFDKTGGVLRFQAIYTRRSPGFDVNDVGYLRQADQQTGYGWLNLTFERPTPVYQRLVWNLNGWWWATTAGLVTDRALNTNVHLTLRNFWTLGAWAVVQGLGTTYCDVCARGGPALRQDRALSTWFDVTGDNRHALVPEVTLTTSSADGGRSTGYTLTPSLMVTASNRLAASAGFAWTWNRNDRQWLSNVADSAGQMHYAFARLEQTTAALTLRASYTVSTTLSLQTYVQPFVSWGTYANVRELASPRAPRYPDRFTPYALPAGNPAGVESRQLNANVVLRWEYHPGSTLFAVWSQGRQGFDDVPGPGGTAAHLRGIFDEPARNTFLVKVSQWLSW